MQPIMNLLLMVGLPVLFATNQLDTATDLATSEYCNDRYAFCIEYPAGALSNKTVSDNGDGVDLASADGTAKVSATGSYNILQWTPSELYSFTISNLPGKGKNLQVVSSNFETDGYECYFTDTAMRYYHRAFFMHDYYVLMIISVPLDKPEAMDRLKEDVSIAFHL